MNALTRVAPVLRSATVPPEYRGIERDAVRMLITNREARTHEHRSFRNLPSVLEPGDVLVVNDSATLPAALEATRANGDTLALHVATAIDSRLWLAEPRTKTLLLGEELALPGGASAVLIAPVEPEHPRLWYVWFGLPLPMNEYLQAFGRPIRYGYVSQNLPLEMYQTMFGRVPGSAEMASAARPFTPRVVRELAQRDIQIAAITLHCGVSSFEPPERPAMERFSVPAQAAQAIARAKAGGRRVIAIGTTALRAIESATTDDGVVAMSGWTSLVIDEGYRLKITDGLLTGFHDTASTHPWILRAFLDRDLLGQAYGEAAERGYYQHEFGDVHLIV